MLYVEIILFLQVYFGSRQSANRKGKKPDQSQAHPLYIIGSANPFFSHGGLLFVEGKPIGDEGAGVALLKFLRVVTVLDLTKRGCCALFKTRGRKVIFIMLDFDHAAKGAFVFGRDHQIAPPFPLIHLKFDDGIAEKKRGQRADDDLVMLLVGEIIITQRRKQIRREERFDAFLVPRFERLFQVQEIRQALTVCVFFEYLLLKGASAFPCFSILLTFLPCFTTDFHSLPRLTILYHAFPNN